MQRIFFLCLFTLLVSCASSLNEASQTRLEALKQRKLSSTSYTSNPRFFMMPVREGQFVQYLIEKEKEHYGLRLEVVQKGLVENSLWFELEILEKKGFEVYRILANIDPSILDNVRQNQYQPTLGDYNQIINVRLWKTGMEKSEQQKTSLLEQESSLPEKLNFFLPWTLGKKESKQTKVGKFQCFQSTSKILWGGSQDIKGCLSERIPLWGFLEAQTAHEKWELVEFGFASSPMLSYFSKYF